MIDFAQIKKKISELNIMEGDPVVWMILILLCIVSIVEVYSASSRDSYGEETFYGPVIKHGSLVCMSLVVAWVMHKIPCKFFKIFTTFSLIFIAFPLMVYSLLFSATLNDTQRWVHMGGMSIQPSELVKITLIGFVAFILSTLRTKSGRANDSALKVVGITTFIFCAMIGKENLSTAGIIFMVIVGMLWLADANRKVLFLGLSAIILSLAMSFMTIRSMSEDTVQSISNFSVGTTMVKRNGTMVEEPRRPLKRFATWAHRLQDKHERPADPKDYPIHDNEQVTHAKIAIANSNIVGRGPGKSIERDFIPQANCDFIYSIILEEGGIECGIAIVGLYLLLFFRSWKIAQQCATRFPAYLVMGLSLMMVLQAMINMAVAVGAFPVTGQPLPLISKGGSSGFITCAYIGMILSVSRSAKKIKPEDEEDIITPIAATA